jgi:F-type H+-transporting ATPase subunit a
MAADHHEAPNATEYIVHHLSHWQTKAQTSIVDFSVVKIDNLFFSLACLGLTLLILRIACGSC